MAKKKKTHRGPRRKRMHREARLQQAKDTGWVSKYQGKNIIKGYRKWFAVDHLCAVIELRKLGVEIGAEREDQIKASIQARAKARKRRKETVSSKDLSELYPDSDGTFAYIAGYTSWGFPYGVTWEELGEKPPWSEEEGIEP